MQNPPRYRPPSPGYRPPFPQMQIPPPKCRPLPSRQTPSDADLSRCRPPPYSDADPLTCRHTHIQIPCPRCRPPHMQTYPDTDPLPQMHTPSLLRCRPPYMQTYPDADPLPTQMQTPSYADLPRCRPPPYSDADPLTCRPTQMQTLSHSDADPPLGRLPPPPRGQTNTCVNITLFQISSAAGKKSIIFLIQVQSRPLLARIEPLSFVPSQHNFNSFSYSCFFRWVNIFFLQMPEMTTCNFSTYIGSTIQPTGP